MAHKASVAERIERLSIPEPNSGCWLWLGNADRQGYGEIMMKKKQKAHRVSWQTFRSEIPAGKHVLHRCDTPGCVNPDHLFIGTASDNMLDMYTKSRHKKIRLLGSSHPGTKLSDDQVREIIASPKYTRGLSQRFGVSNSRISAIRNGHNWKHLHHKGT